MILFALTVLFAFKAEQPAYTGYYLSAIRRFSTQQEVLLNRIIEADLADLVKLADVIKPQRVALSGPAALSQQHLGHVQKVNEHDELQAQQAGRCQNLIC